MASLEGKVIAITGAASGMGLAAARLLASRNASLSLADLNEAALKTIADSLSGDNEGCIVMRVDVRDSAAVDAWIEKTVQRFGKLDGAVNMAGVLGPVAPMLDITPEQLDFVISVNVRGVFNCLRAELRVMKTGSIVGHRVSFVKAGTSHADQAHPQVSAASISGQVALANSSAYCASKAAVISLSKVAAKENGHVRVNCVAPGVVFTPMSADHDPKRVETGIMANAQKRIGSAEEVARVIAFLLSNEASFVSGAVYNVDGAWIY
ncbi:MAG: hypothetical protein M1822_008013 [Bathelium mastoideum]|nr:MAG: hypothetical protein M1822_008013 [Bathelium mastoideum]